MMGQQPALTFPVRALLLNALREATNRALLSAVKDSTYWGVDGYVPRVQVRLQGRLSGSHLPMSAAERFSLCRYSCLHHSGLPLCRSAPAWLPWEHPLTPAGTIARAPAVALLFPLTAAEAEEAARFSAPASFLGWVASVSCWWFCELWRLEAEGMREKDPLRGREGGGCHLSQ